MEVYALNGIWQMREAKDPLWLPAQVPGSVYSDLLRNHKMKDPFYRDNEMDACRLMDCDYIYERTFVLDASLCSHDTLLLECDGLDSLCHIFINGREIAFCNNMHRVWTFDIRREVRVGGNHIALHFDSPNRFVREAYAQCKADGASDCTEGFPHLRKAHCMFGWDWGPRLPDAGIWRNIQILAIDKARLLSVYVCQAHEPGKVTLSFEPEIQTYWPADNKNGYTLTISVIAPDGQSYASDGAPIVIRNPQLWWPNGYGAQPLYHVQATLYDDTQTLDCWTRQVGLRTLTMKREKDQWGESFETCVNGVSIFAMGADYIPEDNIFSRVTPERTRRLLEDCKAANYNTIRVWGGGYYPDDCFYDACDALGLVVWQDFMFACAVYELTPRFAKNIEAEVIDNVRRLRHHPSLGLWCGNNEMEMFVGIGEWVSTPKQKADYIRMYEYLIPKTLMAFDPDTFYWPASPSSGGAFDDPNAENRGDGAVTRKKFRAAAACFEDQTDDGEARAGAVGFWAISGMAKPIGRVLAHIQGVLP